MSAQFIVKTVVRGELVHPGSFINEYLLAFDISQTVAVEVDRNRYARHGGQLETGRFDEDWEGLMGV
jgi:hypothetical protein